MFSEERKLRPAGRAQLAPARVAGERGLERAEELGEVRRCSANARQMTHVPMHPQPEAALGRRDRRLQTLEPRRRVSDEAGEAGETEPGGGHRSESLTAVRAGRHVRLARHLAQPGCVGGRDVLVHRDEGVSRAAAAEVGRTVLLQVRGGGVEPVADARQLALEHRLLLEGGGSDRDVRLSAREVGPPRAGEQVDTEAGMCAQEATETWAEHARHEPFRRRDAEAPLDSLVAAARQAGGLERL